jgi:hypothetical protein
VVNGGRGELVVKEFNSASLSRGARLGVRDYGPSDLGIPTRDEYLVTSANTTMVQYGQIDQRDLDDGQGDQGDEVFLGGGMDDGLGGYSVPRPMRALYSTQWTSQLPPSYSTSLSECFCLHSFHCQLFLVAAVAFQE